MGWIDGHVRLVDADGLVGSRAAGRQVVLVLQVTIEANTRLVITLGPGGTLGRAVERGLQQSGGQESQDVSKILPILVQPFTGMANRRTSSGCLFYDDFSSNSTSP